MAAGIELYNDVLNQKGSPALYSDIFANRPAFGYTGRLFISTDTNEIYRDTGTSWVLISSGGGGTNIYNSDGTLTGTRTLTNGGFDLIFTGASNAFNLDLDANANLSRNISYTTASVDRFKLRVKDNETGSNAGSNFYISVYDDIGTYVLDCLTITRKTGEFYVYAQNDNVTPGTGSINGIFNSTRGTYQLANYTSGSPQSSIYNLFTYDPRTSITYANAQFMGVVGSVMRYEPTDSQTITMTQGSGGIRTQGTALSQVQFSVPATKTLTVSHVSLLNLLGFYNYTGTTGTFAVTNAYGIVINDLNEYSATGLSLTNRWGIYQAGANDINYFNANTLFGTTTNAGYKVDVSGTARVTQSAYFATASGNVGIGTATPVGYVKLTVQSGVADAIAVLRGADPLTATSAAAIATPVTTGFSATPVYSFWYQSGTGIANPANNTIAFNTTGSERMRITSGGNVLVGTTTDAGYLLDVNGSARINSDLRVNTTTGFNTLITQPIGGGGIGLVSTIDPVSADQRLFALGFGSVNYPAQGRIEVLSSEAWSSTNRGNYMTFSTTNNGSAGRTEKMRIASGGNVLIGTTTDSGALLQLNDAGNISFGTTTGTKIGTSTSQKLAFYNTTPIVQPTTAVGSATYASPGAGSTVKTDDTFDGYTLQQVVKALRNLGIIA